MKQKASIFKNFYKIETCKTESKKREKTQITNTRNEIEAITPDPTAIKEMIREYYE